MTHRKDVARGRDIIARWCNLAERRLEYLTDLFETITLWDSRTDSATWTKRSDGKYPFWFSNN